MIGIVSTGIGNVQSLVSLFAKIDVRVIEVTHAAQLDSVTSLVLPGVGAFDPGMRGLLDLDLAEPIKSFARTQRVIGICLGMQLMFDRSDESLNGQPGLGLIPGVVRQIDQRGMTRIPNVGWHTLETSSSQDSSLSTLLKENRFYFSHSYAGVPASDEHALASLKNDHGVKVVFNVGDKVLGFQFHPERSQIGGLRLADWIAETDA